MTPLGPTLSAVARQYGLDAKLLEYRLRRRWPEIVGDQVAAHTRPDAVRYRQLYLIAENSVWLQQLTFLKPSLLEKINAAAGGPILSDIVLRVGEVSGETPQVQSTRGPAKREESDEHDPSPESMAEAAAHAHAVSDPDLRARLTAVIAKALAMPRGKKAQ
jgi:predicted nucleic acid-binding Zn ribbon protein